MIEFGLDGIVLTANQRFLDALGYTLAEITGKPHSLFVQPAYGASPEYRQFWADLRAGKPQVAQFKRIGKDAREVWIEASYNPVLGRDGKPFKIVELASDVTAEKGRYADWAGQLAAINRSQAVIEFDLDGNVLTANEKFLDTLGYGLAEIKGKHHSIFVDAADRASPEYRRFWDGLRAGQYQAAQFRRIGKNGREVWIEASYNVIRDLNGKPFKIVKYATDITARINELTALKSLVDRNFDEIDGALGRSAMQNAASGMAAINDNMVEISAAVQEVGQAVSNTRKAAQVLVR